MQVVCPEPELVDPGCRRLAGLEERHTEPGKVVSGLHIGLEMDPAVGPVQGMVGTGLGKIGSAVACQSRPLVSRVGTNVWGSSGRRRLYRLLARWLVVIGRSSACLCPGCGYLLC